MKLLHLDSSIQGDASASRTLSAAVAEHIRASTPGIETIYRDLAATPIPHLTLDAFGSVEAGQTLQEFIDADIVVIGAGMYNFTVPSQLKAWIDRILVAGQTFRYSENGVEGLAAGKRVIIALARGGLYGEGAPAAALEHAQTYLRTVLGFIGITDPVFIVAEGLAMGTETRDNALTAALGQAKEAAVKLAA